MIRLARVGAPKQPYYRIVVIEKDRARNGRSIEVVGTYNPRTNPATVNLKHERIAYWRSVGATLSPIMQKLVAEEPPDRAGRSRHARARDFRPGRCLIAPPPFVLPAANRSGAARKSLLREGMRVMLRARFQSVQSQKCKRSGARS